MNLFQSGPTFVIENISSGSPAVNPPETKCEKPQMVPALIEVVG